MAKTLLRQPLTPEEAERYQRFLNEGWVIFKEVGGATNRVVMERPQRDQIRRARLLQAKISTEREG